MLASTFALMLAFIIGFAIRRGSICLVEATQQWVLAGHTQRIRAFVVAGAISGCFILPLAWLMPDDAQLAPAWPVTFGVLLAGAGFGLGARLNGGCAFGTINRLGGGDIAYTGTVLGAVSGAIAAMALIEPSIPAASPFAEPGLPGFAALAAFLLLALPALRRRHLQNFRTLFTRRNSLLRPVTAMLVIGAAGGLIHVVAGSWTLWSVLAREGSLATGFSMTGADARAAGGAGAVVAGSVVAAIVSGRFRFEWSGFGAWFQRFAGGAVMGASAAAIPGGNSALLVHSLPSGSIGGWAAYATMTAMLSLSFLPAKRRRH